MLCRSNVVILGTSWEGSVREDVVSVCDDNSIILSVGFHCTSALRLDVTASEVSFPTSRGWQLVVG